MYLSVLHVPYIPVILISPDPSSQSNRTAKVVTLTDSPRQAGPELYLLWMIFLQLTMLSAEWEVRIVSGMRKHIAPTVYQHKESYKGQNVDIGNSRRESSMLWTAPEILHVAWKANIYFSLSFCIHCSWMMLPTFRTSALPPLLESKWIHV
jgi:hypothetical protein